MGKILRADQIREADAYTIANEPISSVDLMERAATVCFIELRSLYPNENAYHIFCGTGNNGGDGLVIARLLKEEGKKVSVFIVRFSPNESEDFKINLSRLTSIGVEAVDYDPENYSLPEEGVIVDAMLGSGVTRKAEGLLANAVHLINSLRLPVVAIDFPSGLFDENNSEANRSTAICATHTLSFEVYKLAFLFPENSKYVGELHLLDIGLNKEFIDSMESSYNTITQHTARSIIHKRSEFSHKGTYGHSLLCSGSKGKMGATILSANACLRSGVGLLTVFIPGCGYEIIQSSVPEAMVITAEDDDLLIGTVEIDKYNAISVGPGIGTNNETAKFIDNLLNQYERPVVLDADALNIISQKGLHESIPKSSILTPHPKEFDRLFGEHIDTYSRVLTAKKMAEKYQVVIVLKGRHTAITQPNGQTYFNLNGNSGMATGGSGDVLTGILTGLLAQGYSSIEAAVLGVYIHGYAGDLAAIQCGEESMIASDITSKLGDVFKILHQE
jgi:NAD(P)H-hydrate epimerase